MSKNKQDVTDFCNQIAEAVDKLGREVAINCMARSLIFVAMDMNSSLRYTCDEGSITVTRKERSLSG